MSDKKGQGKKGINVTLEAFDLKKMTKAQLHEQYTQQADKARDLSQKLQQAYTDIAALKETGSDIMNGQSVLAKSAAEAQATVAAYEEKVAALEKKVKELEPWVGIAQEMARNNTRLVTTVDNVAKMGAALVPNTVTPR